MISSALLSLEVLMELLKPCFKCGQPAVAGPAAVGADARLWTIACPHCGDQSESFSTIEAAAAFWNSRPAPGSGLEDPSRGEAGEDDDSSISDGLTASQLAPA
jgi:hypothetical protein